MGMKHEIEHGLSLDLAHKAIEKAMEAYGERFKDYNPNYEWIDETHGKVSFKAKGVSLSGIIEIEGPKISVDLDVPFIFRIFRGKAIEVIDREVRKWIEKAKNGELD
jgi:hypothetical protein